MHGSIRLGDFGSSKDFLNPHITAASMKSMNRNWSHFVGTPNNMSPEAIDNLENDQISDLWSLGCTIYQLLVGLPPFVASSEYYILLRAKSRDLCFPIKGLSTRSIELIEGFLTIDRTKRLRISEARTFDFFSSKLSESWEYTEHELFCKSTAQNKDEDLPIRFREDALKVECIEGIDDAAVERALWVREWEKKSRPGSGASALENLNVAVN